MLLALNTSDSVRAMPNGDIERYQGTCTDRAATSTTSDRVVVHWPSGDSVNNRGLQPNSVFARLRTAEGLVAFYSLGQYNAQNNARPTSGVRWVFSCTSASVGRLYSSTASAIAGGRTLSNGSILIALWHADCCCLKSQFCSHLRMSPPTGISGLFGARRAEVPPEGTSGVPFVSKPEEAQNRDRLGHIVSALLTCGSR